VLLRLFEVNFFFPLGLLVLLVFIELVLKDVFLPDFNNLLVEALCLLFIYPAYGRW